MIFSSNLFILHFIVFEKKQDDWHFKLSEFDIMQNAIENFVVFNQIILFLHFKCGIMAKKKLSPTTKRNTVRTHRHAFTLNDDENRVLNRYIAKYKITNKTKFIREMLMITIIRKLEEDHPRLFD